MKSSIKEDLQNLHIPLTMIKKLYHCFHFSSFVNIANRKLSDTNYLGNRNFFFSISTRRKMSWDPIKGYPLNGVLMLGLAGCDCRSKHVADDNRRSTTDSTSRVVDKGKQRLSVIRQSVCQRYYAITTIVG